MSLPVSPHVQKCGLCLTSDFLSRYVKRFWSSVYKTETCWVWLGPVNQSGYGAFAFRHQDHRHVITASRISYLLATTGPIPEKLFVMHSCDNPPCVNPSHLSLGTNQENILDAIAKGIMRPGNHRLSPEQRTALLSRIQDGERIDSFIHEFPVSRSQAYRLKDKYL